MTLPRLILAQLPTPIEPMPRLTTLLGGPTLFCKRDDQTGLAFGGNKTRKLEFVMAEAQAEGAKTIISVGGIQSNHCRQTAALAAKMGLKCILVLSGVEPEIANGNLLLDRLLGAEIIWTTREERDLTLQKTFMESKKKGEKPFLIPLGASTATGTLGYAEAMKEFCTQGVEIDWIVLGSSSAGTQAGLVLGQHLYSWKGKILGISIDHPAAEIQQEVAKLATEGAKKLNHPVNISPEDIFINDQYLGGGYAIAGDPELEAICLFARYEGLFLDPVYTGRAAAGMIDLIRNGFFKQEERVLFWHTGGSPALFAEPYCSQLNHFKL